jgi:hypothetical protein
MKTITQNQSRQIGGTRTEKRTKNQEPKKLEIKNQKFENSSGVYG